jgi:hypothetical protein
MRFAATALSFIALAGCTGKTMECTQVKVHLESGEVRDFRAKHETGVAWNGATVTQRGSKARVEVRYRDFTGDDPKEYSEATTLIGVKSLECEERPKQARSEARLSDASVIYCYSWGGQWYHFSYLEAYKRARGRSFDHYKSYPHPECVPKDVKPEDDATPFDGYGYTYAIRSTNRGAVGFDRSENYRFRHWIAGRCETDAECAALSLWKVLDEEAREGGQNKGGR